MASCVNPSFGGIPALLAFFVAHRISTVQRADLILVLENGRIMEAGDHGDLLRLGGLYTRLCAEQLIADETLPEAASV